MGRLRLSGFVTLALLSGFCGGVLSRSLLAPLHAFGGRQSRRPGLVTAREFRVEDEQGVPRAVFTVEGDHPSLSFFSGGGDQIARLDVILTAEKEPALRLRGRSTKALVSIGLEERRPGITVCDGGSETAIAVTIRSGEPVLGLTDRRSQCRALLSIIAGSPELLLYDEESNLIWHAP